MLRASYRVLKPGGRIAVAAIAVAEGLAIPDRAAAVAAGPDHVASEDSYPALLIAAGFDEVEAIGVSAEYRNAIGDWIQAWDAERNELERLLGSDEFVERQARRGRALAAAERGLLHRLIVTGRRGG